MFRLFPVVLALSFTIPASAAAPVDEEELLAFDDGDEPDAGGLERGKVKGPEADKKKKGTTAPAKAAIPDLDDEPVEEFDMEEDEPTDEPQLGDFDSDEEPVEDFDRPASKPAAKPAAAKSNLPGPIELDVAGKEPLADNYPLSVVAVDRDAVVVELPVLVARSRVGVEKGFLLVGEVYAGTVKVGEVRQAVTPASLAEFGPSFAFLKILAPVVERRGEIKVVVKKANLDGSGSTELFTRVTPYALR